MTDIRTRNFSTVLVLLAVTAFCLFAALPGTAEAAGNSRVVTYPMPDADDLLSEDYDVEVSGEEVGVYRAETNDHPIEDSDYGGPYSFVQFDFSGTVTVTVRADRDLRNAIMRPLSEDIEVRTPDKNTAQFTLQEPCRLSFEPDGEQQPLLVFANPVQQKVPEKDAPGVTYFGPGVHRPEGDVVTLDDGETLYLAGGAVLRAGIRVQGDNVTVRGRGIVDGTPWPWRKGPTGTLFVMDGRRNVTIRGIIVRGSPHWTIVPRGCENVTVRNVKICNSRVQNDDGINPCNSRNVRIEDCFIRSDDDCIAIKGLKREWGDVEDIVIEDTVLWVDRARVTLLGHESRAEHMRNITYRNIDIIHAASLPIFLLEPGEDMVLSNVTFKNIRVNGNRSPGGGGDYLAVVRPTVNRYMDKKVPGHIRDIVFHDITVQGGSGPNPVLVSGRDETHRTANVTFRNVRVRETTLEAGLERVKLGKWIDDIVFTSDK